MRTLGHVPALDGLRGIAILLVLAVHADGLIPGGWFGVDLFFVLSGFLITSILIGEWGAKGRISLSDFYRRRGLRLFPALALMLGVYVLLGGDRLAALYGATYSMNVVRAAGVVVPDGMEHLWSLAAEEQFYLVWPPILYLALRRGVTPKMLATALLLVIVAAMTWRAVLASSAPHYRLVLGPDTHADPILIGCIAGLAFSFRFVSRVPSWLASAALVPASVLVAFLGYRHFTSAYGLATPAFALACAVVVLACVLHRNWWFGRLVNRAPLRYLGRISYGVYLWHLPLYFALGWEVGLPLALAISALSYRYVEQPFLRRKRPRAHIAQAPVPVVAT